MNDWSLIDSNWLNGLYSSPTDNGWDGAYPSSLATMQFMAHAKRRSEASGPANATTLYFAAHDTAASSKTLTWAVPAPPHLSNDLLMSFSRPLIRFALQFCAVLTAE